MSLLSDVRSVSENVIEQISARFPDLPRPLLAAIGAGDMAVEKLAKLREQLTSSVGADGVPSAADVKALATDLPTRARKIAGEVARTLEEFTASAPEKVQRLIGELPGKTSELGESLSPENLRGTVESYTQLVAMIYDNLAERGGKAVAQARPAVKAAPKGATGKATTGKATTNVAATKPASSKAAPKPATPKPATKAASKTAPKPARKAAAAAAPKTAPAKAGAKATVKATPKAAQKITVKGPKAAPAKAGSTRKVAGTKASGPATTRRTAARRVPVTAAAPAATAATAATAPVSEAPAAHATATSES